MAPETANQKRKRGRGANASRDNETASHTPSGPAEQEATALPNGYSEAVEPEEDARPRKRGRPAKTAQPEPEPEVPLAPEPVAAGAAPTGKRKRGRPSLAGGNKGPENPEIAPLRTNGDLGAKKGGRKGPSQQPPAPDSTPIEPEVEAEESQPKRRGRPPRAAKIPDEPEGEAEEADDENEGNSSLLRRGARERRKVGVEYKGSPGGKPRQDATEDATNQEPEAEKAGSSRLPRGGSKRPSPRAGEKKAQNPVEEQNVASDRSSQRRRVDAKGRPVLEDIPDGSPDHASTPRPKPRKRSRPFLEKEPEVQAAEVPQIRQKKRGRPSLSSKEADANAKPRRQRKAKEQDQVQEEDAEAEDEHNSPDAVAAQPDRRSGKGQGDVTAPKKRKSKHASAAQAEDRSQSPDPVEAPFRQLTTRTRRVPRDIIDKKWTPLDATSISSINDLLSSASRPVLLRLNNQQRHAQATAALNIVRQKLRTKLSRGLPFPPPSTSGKREDELQFERTVDGIQSLEAQLDPLLHGVALLKQEKEKAERELDHDYRTLNALSANARSENRERRDRLRKMHVLVPEPPRHEKEKDAKAAALGDLVPRGPVEESGGKVFVGLESNDELRGLAHQIGNHMESMRSNLQQVEGVAPAIADSRAALKMVLMPNLDPAAYEKVLLG
ncbi:hypothetical protein PG994_001518 [Apiospora phragmitis]|uniref:Kinetochore protein fta7 n=1 Tax=Apiospora phragmitis TaxID=2905665 RepID=A0ABR1WTP4_9PEZI